MSDLVDRLRNSVTFCDEAGEAANEIERLTACLKRANANHEHFEREWYLRGDELSRLRLLNSRLVEALKKISRHEHEPCAYYADQALAQLKDEPAAGAQATGVGTPDGT